jgi:predicted dehydrogenase
MDGFLVRHVFDPDLEAGRTLATCVGANTAHSVADAVVGCDSVVIATPPHTHADVFEIVAPHVDRVRVEKPLAQSFVDAVRMRMLAAEYETTVTVGHTTCFQQAIPYVARLVAADPNPVVYGRLCARAPRHAAATSPVYDLMCHDIAAHLLMVNNENLSVAAVGYHDGMWTARLSDGSAFVASWQSDRNRRTIVGSGWGYSEADRKLVIGGEGRVFADDDPLQRELETWRQGGGFPLRIGVRVVELCEQIDQQIRRQIVSGEFTGGV